MNTQMQAACRDIDATFIATEIDVTLFARNIREAAKNAADHLKK